MIFERPETGEKAILVDAFASKTTAIADRFEFTELAFAAGVQTEFFVVTHRKRTHSRFFISSALADQIKTFNQTLNVDLVLFNQALNPSQEQGLEKLLGIRVVDRIQLILDIFAQRARSYEGKLQVERAQLEHMTARLKGGWTHLERQRGGIGLRGPGETQLETDQRLVSDRIKRIDNDLEKVIKRRNLNRKSRAKQNMQVISLVGYTNAGKSTLFKRLTGENAYIEDALFATLDTTIRRIQAFKNETVLITDTVGFIQGLPHELVAAFRATLEETKYAQFLLHVIDVSDPEHDQKRNEVIKVLEEIGAGKVPMLEIYNKIDALPKHLQTPRIDYNSHNEAKRVWMSAAKGWGVELLFQALEQTLHGRLFNYKLNISHKAAKFRAYLHEHCKIVDETNTDSGWHMSIQTSIEHRKFIENASDVSILDCK